MDEDNCGEISIEVAEHDDGIHTEWFDKFAKKVEKNGQTEVEERESAFIVTVPKTLNAADGSLEMSQGQMVDSLHENWLNKMIQKLERDSQTQANEEVTACCIFTVPKTLVTLKDKKTEYLPQIVSLGPYHFLKSEQFASMEKIKSEVACSIQNMEGKCFISKIVKQIAKEEESIRHCYDKELEMKGEVLAWMLAVDSSFILQFLRQRLLSPTKQRGQLIRAIESLPLVETLEDIVKLENQIPLSVLRIFVKIETKEKKTITEKEAMEEQKRVPLGEDPLNDILQNICIKLSPISIKLSPISTDNRHLNFDFKEGKHILECLRSHVVGSDAKQKSTHVQEEFTRFDAVLHKVLQWLLGIVYAIVSPCIWQRKNDNQAILPPAVELHKAGIKFKPAYSGVQEIRFDRRRLVLHLPEIKVEMHTETIMRNMMAFELCSATCKDKAPVTRYAHLMDQLINTEKDVALLSKYGIIRNKLENDSKVADFWNTLTDSTSIPPYEPIDDTTDGLKSYYQRRRTTSVILWNEFLEDRCAKPWHILALVASIVALVITVSASLSRILH